MDPKTVLVFLTDRWADWEAAYAIAAINQYPEFAVRTVADGKTPVTSLGGMRTAVDHDIHEYARFDNTAMLILPGSYFWREGRHDAHARFVKTALDARVPVAAICGAAIFLGKHGFLDRVRHTGDAPECFTAEKGYGGEKHYVSAQVVADQGIITANETAAVQFAYEIFKVLALDDMKELDIWRENYTYGMVR